ncbi:MAG: dihydroxy-acid dehydratase, partial [Candidatus Bathyarchaeia archaeon]
MRRSWILDALIRTAGFMDEDLRKPLVEVVNTWSEWNPGHNHLRHLSEAVKRGVWQAGGFPLEYNTLSLCPGQTLPNRNLLAMETESVFLSEPADAAVFICTCDKDIPALLMASVRINIPSIFVLGGSMLPGSWKGKEVVCCTDYQWVEAEYRAGRITKEDLEEFHRCVLPCSGACGPMGTANTMQSL